MNSLHTTKRLGCSHPGSCSSRFPAVFLCFIACRCCLVRAALVAVSLPPARGKCGSVCAASAQPLQGPSDSAAELPAHSHIIKTHPCCSARASPHTLAQFSRTKTLRHQECSFITNGGAGGNDTLLPGELLLLSASHPLGLFVLSL